MQKIAILDDHPTIIAGLKSLLNEHGFEVVCSANTLADFLIEIEMYQIDIFIVDVVLQNSTGINSFTKLISLNPKNKIIAYTSLNNFTLISMLIKAEVMAYVSKNDTFENLLEAINSISNNQKYFPEEYASLFLKNNFDTNTYSIHLTEREIDVLNQIYEGNSSIVIAQNLFISVNTVETHRKNIFLKFDVNNIASLLNAAQKTGFLK